MAPTLFQRILLIYLFIFCGLVISFQVADQFKKTPAKWWTRLTKETRPYWYTFYVFEALLLSQITHRILLYNANGMLFGLEEQILDGIWFGLLGLEALMITGLAIQGLYRAVAPRPKQKAQ